MKIYQFTITLILALLLITPVQAKNDNEKENNSKASRTVQIETDDEDEAEEQESEDNEVEVEDEDEESDSALSPSEAAKSRNAVRKLERIQEETNNPEVGEQVQEMTEEQERIQERVVESLDTVDERPAFVKFLIGPDYKNLGQLRKEVVQTRNNIRQLEKLGEKATGDTKVAIDEAIDELESTALNLQASIGEKLEGFSLFGWLFRWLGDFDAPEEPVVTPLPSISPEASVEPIVTTEPTITPTPEVEVSPSPSTSTE